MKWSDAALQSLAEIVDYYEAEAGIELAEFVEGSILSCVEGYAAFPLSAEASDMYLGTRRIVIARLPYVAFIREASGEWQVVDVVHTSRRLPKDET